MHNFFFGCELTYHLSALFEDFHVFSTHCYFGNKIPVSAETLSVQALQVIIAVNDC